jgi:predicted ATPase
MISLVEVRNFRSLRALQRPLGNFHVLVGPNASGKTTFLDVFRFLGDIIEKGIDKAIADRTPNFLDLTFGNAGGAIEFAVEAIIPDTIRQQLGEPEMDRIRYEIQLGLSTDTGEHAIFEERVVLYDSMKAALDTVQQRLLFPTYQSEQSIINRKFKLTTYRQIVHKIPKGNDSYGDETLPRKQGARGGAKGWIPFFRLGIKRSALGHLPASEEKLPATVWLRDMLVSGAQLFILDSLNIRRPSPPGLSRHFRTDGSNLPWVIEELRKSPSRFEKWIAHIRTALPDVDDIDTVERPEDKHRYLRVRYNSGLTVPSWLVSDGTLRLLALTLPAYLPDFSGLYLIEEPENGIHPAAMETIYQSLSAIYGAQMLLATHSPVILGMVEPQQVLCFAKTPDGVTDIVRGDEHPLLRDWQGDINLSQIYASGILG